MRQQNTTERARRLAAQVVGTSRRGLLCGALGVSAATVLTACGSTDDDADGDANTGGDGGDATGSSDDMTSGDGGDTGDEPADGTALAQVADIPVGGGILVGEMVLVQPAEGEIMAFDAHCTHQGTIVGAPADGVITCPNHGSQFGIDGAVVRGPAEAALTEVPVTVTDGQVFAA